MRCHQHGRAQVAQPGEVGLQLEHLDVQVHAVLAGLGFGERIIPVDSAVAQRSAALHVPDPRPFRDSLIAATALVRDLTVVTRNVADFAPMGVKIVNPWQDSTPA